MPERIPGRPEAIWQRARRLDRCRTCDRLVWPGQRVGRWSAQWQHAECVRAQASVWLSIEHPQST